ncbi:hypothetical protein [Nocardia brasiliensis]|uniref:hypothetical protein n=1 Tax=Nocardia brasiliensis TaxID=37326 RepID=UPI0036719138
MAHTRGLALATALPLVAALLAGRPAVAAADLQPPKWSPLGEIATGSSSPGSAANGSTFEGNSLDLGPSAPTENYGDLGTGSAGSGHTGPALADEAAEVVAEDSEQVPELDSGSVRSACAGGVAVGSALILLGIATGSGLRPGSAGLGSSASGLGSAAVGSAVTGGALVCLLWPLDSAPPAPGLPLQLDPPVPGRPIPDVPALPTPNAAAPPAPSITAAIPDIPPLPTPPRPTRLEAAELTADPIAWNIMQLLTIMLITILTTVRGITIIRRKHAG